MLAEKGRAVTWRDLRSQWGLLEYSFLSVLHTDIEDVWNRKSWRWFTSMVSRLLSDDTPIARFFAPREKPEAPDGQ